MNSLSNVSVVSAELVENWRNKLRTWWSEQISNCGSSEQAKARRFVRIGKMPEAVSEDVTDRELDRLLDKLIWEFAGSLRNDSPIVAIDCDLSIQEGAMAVVEFPAGSQNFAKHLVPGLVAVKGRVIYQDGNNQTFFQRFISHPFWQSGSTPRINR